MVWVKGESLPVPSASIGHLLGTRQMQRVPSTAVCDAWRVAKFRLKFRGEGVSEYHNANSECILIPSYIHINQKHSEAPPPDEAPSNAVLLNDARRELRSRTMRDAAIPSHKRRAPGKSGTSVSTAHTLRSASSSILVGFFIFDSTFFEIRAVVMNDARHTPRT